MPKRGNGRAYREQERRVSARLAEIRPSIGLPDRGPKNPDPEAHRAKLDELAAEYHRISGGELGWECEGDP